MAVCDEVIANEALATVTAEQVSSRRLHVSCESFKRCSLHHVQQWTEEASPVPVMDVFKQRTWGYAFVTVDSINIEAFSAAVTSASFRGSAVVVKEGVERGRGTSRAADEEFGGSKSSRDDPNAKRRKMRDFPEGYVPTLKDLRDKEKQRKRDVEVSISQRSAPLFEWPYETQLEMKGTYVKSAVRAFTKLMKSRCEDEGHEAPPWTTPEWSLGTASPVGCGCPLERPLGTPEGSRKGYRNKCEFTIGHTEDGEIDCGYVLRTPGNGKQIVDSADDTPHTPEPFKRLCKAVRDIVRASPHAIFDRTIGVKTGVWRLVMARLVPSTEEQLVMVQIAPLATEELQQELVKQLVEGLVGSGDKYNLKVVSIYLQHNDTPTDAARADAPLFCVYGKPRLEMPLLGLRFEIGPTSFLQTNSVTCALLYEKALEWLRPEGSIVLDVCCGVGTIGLCAAARCKKVIGLEIVPEAVESAKQNTALNGIENAEFRVGKAEDTIVALLKELDADEDVCAVVDPPRGGLHKTVLEALKRCPRLSRLVYVSCNPDSLVEDVVKLMYPCEGVDPFVPVKAVAVDMFPHTLHCEMILLLERSSRIPDPRPRTAEELEALSAKKRESRSGGGGG